MLSLSNTSIEIPPTDWIVPEVVEHESLFG